MKRNRFTDEQIIGILKEHEAGTPVAELCRKHGVIMLRILTMYGMAQAVTDLIEQDAPAFDAAVPILFQLLKAEVAEREVRSIAYHMKAARFPAQGYLWIRLCRQRDQRSDGTPVAQMRVH